MHRRKFNCCELGLCPSLDWHLRLRQYFPTHQFTIMIFTYTTISLRSLYLPTQQSVYDNYIYLLNNQFTIIIFTYTTISLRLCYTPTQRSVYNHDIYLLTDQFTIIKHERHSEWEKDRVIKNNFPVLILCLYPLVLHMYPL